MEYTLILGGTLLLLIPESTLYSLFGILPGNHQFPECFLPAIIPLIGLFLIGFGFIMKYKHILLGCSRSLLELLETTGMNLLSSTASSMKTFQTKE
jgi:hypothetical protein